MEIRKMRPEDSSRAYALICESLDSYFVPSIVDYFMKQWPGGQIVATDFTGDIIGYMAGSRLSGGRVSIALFCVKRGFRGQGIGSGMLDRFRRSAMMDGARSIQLEVRETNSEAISFYRRRGFMPVERLEHFYEDGGTGIRMVANVFGVGN